MVKAISVNFSVRSEMCSERDSPLEPFVLPAPGQPELARLTCGAHLGPPVLTRKQKRPRVNSLVCDRAAAFCAAGPPEALFWMSRLVTQAAKHERELARAHSQRLKQATLSLPGESVSRGFADRGALEGYPSHYTSLVRCMFAFTNLIPIWISNHVSSKVWDEITYPFPNFNGCAIEFWEWISNFIPHFYRRDYFSMLGLKWIHFRKRAG